MKRETRTVIYDDELRIEAYRFEGIVQPFPNHFHEHYVIGFVEKGQRILSCKHKKYCIEKGNVVLFNPGDNHACVQNDGGTFDYRSFHISKNIMLELAEEVTGKRELPGFSPNVIYNEEITGYLYPLHEMLMKGAADFGKEENRLIAEKLKIVFAEWIDNGHNNFDDENTIILCVELTGGLLLSHGTRYEF